MASHWLFWRKSAKVSALSCFLFFSPTFSPFPLRQRCYSGSHPLRVLLSPAAPSHHLITLFHFIHYSSYSFCLFPLSVQSCFSLSHSHLPTLASLAIALFTFYFTNSLNEKFEFLSSGSIREYLPNNTFCILPKWWLPKSFQTFRLRILILLSISHSFSDTGSQILTGM